MTAPLRRASLAALVALAACHGSSPSSPADPPVASPAPGDPSPPTSPAPPAPPETPPAPTVDPGPFVVGSGAGRSALEGSVTGAPEILVSADHGLYLLDPALAGEPSLQGDVYVSVRGATPPDDTTVELNGVPLVRQPLPGSPESPFRLDVGGPQPEPDADGLVTITVRSGGLVKAMSLPCPPDLAVRSSAAPDSELRGRPALELSWDGDIEANEENPFPTAFTTSAKLMHYSYATHVVGDEHYATKYVPAGTRSVSLEVAPSDDGFCAELRWQGKYVEEGNSRGFCGRAKRIEYRY